MTMKGSWAPAILVLSCSAAVFAAPAPAVPALDALGRAYASKPAALNRARLATFAKAHPKDRDGALALLSLAATDIENGKTSEAIDNLLAAKPRLAALADYVTYFLARSLAAESRTAEALAALDSVLAAKLVSPLRRQAVLLTASILNDRGEPGDVRRSAGMLRASLAELPQPRGIALYAAALEALGDRAGAAIEYQRVWYGFPLSGEAAGASDALARLRAALDDTYPPPMPQAMLRRASLLVDGRQYTRALAELNAMIPDLGGEDRDLARVRIGVLNYARGRRQFDEEAFRYLGSLSIPASEANAERLYYYLAAARRLDREEAMRDALAALERDHASSKWRLEALISAGNYYLLDNKTADYEPLYRACADSFPFEPQAALCHWKIAWLAYLQRRPAAANLLRDHVRRFPMSTNAASALYFLGRLNESSHNRTAARACYQQIASRYPGYYYAGLARQRLNGLPDTGAALASFAPSPDSALEFFRQIPLPETRLPDGFQPDAATQVRIDRARLLASAGLDQLAEAELRFAAGRGARPNAIAIELARLTARRGAIDAGLWHIRALAPGYLHWPMDAAPEEFWRAAYPLPYRDALERFGRANSLDPFLLAGLIRQESAFNPRAVSRERAVGLTQLLPSTGAAVSRKLGIRFSRAHLYQAEPNLRLGARHLRDMIDSLNGDLVAALAAYNAGKSRPDNWLNWGEFREPAEFIETIPFTETREYVQAVLRNADMYRRLYAGSHAALPSTGGSSRPKTAGADSAGARSGGLRKGAVP